MECSCIAETYINPEATWSLVLAIVAIIISVISIFVDRKINRSTLQADFYASSFQKAQNESIPQARRKLRFHDECIEDYEELQSVLAEIRKGADFFKYADPRFYEQFKKANQEVEDFIADGLNRRYDDVRANAYLKECDEKLHKLYKVVTRHYFG